MDWQLHEGRCQDILPGNYAGQADLILTSPPYDTLRSYGGHMDAWDFEAVAAACASALVPGGILVWVIGDAVIDGSETLSGARHAIHFCDVLGLRLHQTLIYERWNLSGLRANAYVRDFEHMFVFANGTPRVANLLRDRKAKNPTGKSPRRGLGRNGDARPIYPTGAPLHGTADYGRRGSIWRYLAGKAAGNRNGDLHYQTLAKHPAIFPQDLAADHIKSWTNPGDLVLDPMCGSGTTLRAAADLGRRGVGIEVNPEYCALIRQRMAQEVLL